MSLTPQFDIPCIILCGGKSSRMGEDKALLPFGEYPTLVQYQYERLKPYFKEIYLSSKVDKFDFLKKSGEHTNANIIFDQGEVHSPLVALKSILESINLNKAFILTVDTPFVTLDTISQLIKASNGFDITVAKTQKLHNLCGVFDKSCLCEIDSMISQDFHKIGALLKKVKTSTIEFYEENEFLNLNKKEDYLKAISIIS